MVTTAPTPTVIERKPRLGWRVLGALALFAAGLLACAVVVRFTLNRAVRPERDTGMARQKLQELAQVAPQIDTLVLGTSRLLHGFDPREFAAETARLGRPRRAYNLSLQRLLLWEQERVLDDALTLPGFKPRLVLIEPAVGLGISPENFTHARTVEFETPHAWRLAVASVLDSNRSLPHKAWNIAAHSLVAALHGTHYGLYNGVAFPPVPVVNEIPGPDSALRGFFPRADRSSAEPAPTWLVEMQRDYAERFAADAATPRALPAAMREHFAALHVRLAARGIVAIFVQPPQLGFTTPELRELTFGFQPALVVGPQAVPVLNYLDPRTHPALFEPRWWMDYNHVSQGGAALFTRALARDVVALESSTR
jgi:hypothetical protein